MNDTHCPICYTPLEVRDVAPCMDCGALPHEIEHALSGRHTYAEYRIFGDLTLILCDFHQVDFGSYDPTYFGLPKNTRIGFQKMQFVRSIDEIQITKDKYCPECDRRLAFLKFLAQTQQLNTTAASKSAEGAPPDPNVYGSRTFDLYGWQEGDLEDIKAQLESALDQKLEWHESGYRMAEYYRCLTHQGEEIRLTRNIPIAQWKLESQYPNAVLLLYIWRTQRASELEDRIVTATQATLLRREELDGWCCDSQLDEYANLIIASLAKYGELDKAEARRRVEGQGFYTRESHDTELGCGLTFHEFPYNWAMGILYGKTHPYWWTDRDLKIETPPEGTNRDTGLTDEEEELARNEVTRKGWYA